MNLSAFVPLSLCLFVVAAGAQAATPIDETRPLDPNARVEVNNVRGSIRVTGSQRNDIRITGSIGDGAKGLVVEGDRRRLSVRVDYPNSNGWGGWWGRGDIGDSTLIVELPAGVELTVESVSADIEIANITGERLEVETVSGDAEVSSAAKRVEVDAVSGDIGLKLTGTQEVDVETVSGDLDLEGSVLRAVRAETVSGEATVRLPEARLEQFNASTVSGEITADLGLTGSGRISIESLSGDVSLVVPSAVSATLRIDTFSGSIRSELGNVDKKRSGPGSSLQTKLGSGEGQIRIESFSGDVRVRTR